MPEFLHVGVPTKDIQENETYLEGLNVYVTNPDDHPYKYEFLRFEKCSPLPAIMQVQPHVAFKVDSIEEELKNVQEVIVEPFAADENTTIVFVIKDNVIFELLEVK